MKNGYISYEQMSIHLQKGRHERSQALASMFSILFSMIKNYLIKNKANPPKTAVCVQVT